MKQPHQRNWKTLALMLIVTVVVASTAIRIEWYNHAVGGFLPRPQPPSMEGNEVKWLATGPYMEEWHFRMRIATERNLQLDWVDDKEALFAMELTAEQQSELEERKHHAQLNADFRNLVSSMGLLQYPLVAAGLILSWLTLRSKKKHVVLMGGLCLSINLVACVLERVQKAILPRPQPVNHQVDHRQLDHRDAA